MSGRTARVGLVSVKVVLFGSIVQVGDTASVETAARVLAVQRQLDHRIGGEVYFEAFPLFRRTPPAEFPPPLAEEPPAAGLRSGRFIDVGSIRIISVTVASLLRAGNAGGINADSRIKHFRQFASQPPAGVISETARFR